MAVFEHPTSRPVSRRRVLLGLSAVAASTALPHLPKAHAAPTPEDRLQKEFGLVRLSGTVWGLPLEVQLKEKLAQLPLLRESVVTAEKELDDRAAANRRAWTEAAPTMETMKQALGQLSPTDPKRAPLAQQLAALETSVSEPSRLSLRGEIRNRLIAFSRDRSLLALALLWIRAQVPQMTEQYAKLAQREELTAALKQLGNDRLGPQKNYTPEVKRLAEYDKLVFTDWLPAYQQATQTRFSAIVNEQAPVTFSWTEETGAELLLPSSAVEPCGLTIPERAPQQVVKLGERRLMATKITIPSLRLGRHLAKNIAALVLPPEGEDLGAQLPRHLLSGLRINIELDRLRMTIAG